MKKRFGKYMKRTTRLVLIGVSCFCLLLSGCRLLQAEEQKMLPVTVHEIQRAISKFLPEHSKLFPFPGHTQHIIRKDLDGDEVHEGIAYFRKGNQYEILVVKRNDRFQWEKWNQIPLPALLIASAKFVDVTRDQRLELILETKTDHKDPQKRLLIYELSKMKQKQLLNQPYDHQIVYDFQQDGHSEVILFSIHRDSRRKVVETKATLYDARDHDFFISHQLRLQGEAIQVLAGKVNEEKKGIFVDLNVGFLGGGTTELLFPERGVLVQGFQVGGLPYHYKMVNQPSLDVNHDRVIEWAWMDQPVGATQIPLNQSPYVYRWYQWRSKGKPKLVRQYYEDLYAGYIFEYGHKWTSKILPVYDPVKHQVSFYYSRPNQAFLKKWKLFTIARYSNEEWQQLQKQKEKPIGAQQFSNPILLKKSGSFVYAAFRPTPDGMKNLEKCGIQSLVPTVTELKKQLILLTSVEKRNKLALRKGPDK